MKKITGTIFFLMIFLPACASAPAGQGISTPVAITAQVSTVIAGNSGTAQPFPTLAPPTSIPTLPGGLSVSELKYRILDQFPDFFFCDPDFYPIARDEESDLAVQAFPELQANQAEFQTILSHNGLTGVTAFTDEQKLQVYREHKKLNAIFLQIVNDKYQFQIQTGKEEQSGTAVTGTIDGKGVIDISKRDPAMLTCPICLAAGTRIDTPRGAVRVEKLRVGDPVWTQDDAGRRVPASIVQVGSVRVPTTHQMIHITLADGRELWASPGHPTSDGRMLGDLGNGEILDGAKIVLFERVGYDQSHTFDILPSGATGFYWSNGILMGSTLSSPSRDNP